MPTRRRPLACASRLQRTPSVVPDDPDYRRLRYVRYADDFLLGFIGPRDEAEAIKRRIGEFLRDQLKLELSETKTLITHARTEHARFLGYDIGILQRDDSRGQGTVASTGRSGCKMPAESVREKCQSYMRSGKADPSPGTDPRLGASPSWRSSSRRYRGFAEYYKLAPNRSYLFGRLKWVMETALDQDAGA